VPYGATFLIFSDYMRPPMRLAALMGLHTIYVFTHDSIGLGEDGPTHQPIEQLAGLRAVPRLTVIRPADATETTEAWRAALLADGPVALVLTRQGLPVLDRGKYPSAELLSRGAYTLVEGGPSPDIILMATGSEVHLALESATALEKKGVAARVVSMPSWELFEAQEQSYRDSVLPPHLRARLAIEAGSPVGWHRWVGLDGDVIGIERFGASAPYKTIFEKFGFTIENVTSRAMALVQGKNSPLS